MSADDNLEFLDTNILVYAHDRSSGEKCEIARSLVDRLWHSRQGCVSIQVLQEFYVVITRKVRFPLSPAEAERVVTDIGTWRLHAPQLDDVLKAIEVQQRYQTSFWDAMLLQSAFRMGCKVLWSEDLNPEQLYQQVLVKNPFAND